MDGVSENQEHKFHSAHQLYLSNKKSFRNIDIPPRKLLTRRLAALSSQPSMEIMYRNEQSPRVLAEESVFQKFLPNSGADDDSDPYASDQFRMYEFKIRKCTRSRSHDWTDCPFSHPGEKARRRCPRRFSYSGTICEDFRRGNCIRGDTCEFAHGVFECWLHPSRYRTEACKDGKHCPRKICFFAHTSSQLRSPTPAEMTVSPNKHVTSSRCANCSCHSGVKHSISPTSVLEMEKMSPPSPISCLSNRTKLMTPQAIRELMAKMKVMNMNSVNEPQASNLKSPMRMDSYAASNHDQQSFFSVSPSTPYASGSGSSQAGPSGSGSSRAGPSGRNYAMNDLNEGRFGNETPIGGGLDVNWVNDLLA